LDLLYVGPPYQLILVLICVGELRTPTMAGGLFAMDRKYFAEMGKYDPGLNIWGGENLEISFRVRLCSSSVHCIRY